MIDRSGRDQLALLLRRYAACRITNDDLADAPSQSQDRAVGAVYGYAWNLYDDVRIHRAEGQFALLPDTRRMVARWIVFQHSDQEYGWPHLSLSAIRFAPLNWLTFGWWARRAEQRFKAFRRAGHFGVWPFFNTAEFRKALKHPRYLRGRAS